jgi:ketosteroid isomerase-like protein
VGPSGAASTCVAIALAHFGILGREMSEESTTSDPVELTRQLIDAGNRRDLDAAMRLFAPDVVWESLDGLGVFVGSTAVRGFLGDWLSSYEVFSMELKEVLELGGGIAFAAGHQVGRLLGATASVEQGSAWGIAWEDGLAVRVVASVDTDKARAAAGRLAQKLQKRESEPTA